MAGFGPGGCLSALLGAFLFHGASMFLGSSYASAAWGWKMNVTGDFTCTEGTQLGCPGMGQPGYSTCGAANFTCTVACKNGNTPSPATVKLQCAKDATPTTFFDPKSGGACINIGMTGHAKDSKLSWSAAPCTAASAATRVAWQPLAAMAVFAAAVPL